MDFLDKFFEFLASLIPVVTALSGLGLIMKYVPVKALGYFKNELIPYLNTLVAFFGAFGGGAAVAHAGVFGDLGHFLSLGARAGGSVFVAIFSRQLFETYLRPLADAIGLRNNEHMVGRA